LQWGTTNFTGWKQEFNGNVYLSQTISWWCDRMFNSILLNNFWGEIEMNAAGAAAKTVAPAAALVRRWTGESSRSKAAAAPRLRADTQLGQVAKARQKWDFKKSWNWRIILVAATIWQILNMKQATGNGSCENLHGKSREFTLGELIFWRVFDIWNDCVIVHVYYKYDDVDAFGEKWIQSAKTFSTRCRLKLQIHLPRQSAQWCCRDIRLRSLYFCYKVVFIVIWR